MRKPRGIGLEFTSIADGQSGILLGLEPMEGKERQRSKEFTAIYGAGAAQVMRLAKPWQGSGRVIIADAAFASRRTAVGCHKELGLF